jgi:hypothetical protein
MLSIVLVNNLQSMVYSKQYTGDKGKWEGGNGGRVKTPLNPSFDCAQDRLLRKRHANVSKWRLGIMWILAFARMTRD